MRAHRGNAHPDAGLLHQISYHVGGDRPSWCPAGEEHRRQFALRAGLGEIGDQRLTDVDRQRESVDPAGLAADGDLADAPVHVVQFQSGDLNRPQPQPSEEQHYRQVTGTDRRRLVAAVKQGLDRVLWQPRRDSGVVPACDRRHRRCQRNGCLAGHE
jgi:hypothetical protein